jgi:hypothetical protein
MKYPYEPNESPFGESYKNWLLIKEERMQMRFLGQFSDYDLAEFGSCALAIFDRPIHSDDTNLPLFNDQCQRVLLSRVPEQA